MFSFLRVRPNAAEAAAGARLDTWKEIAVYLKRDVRTVQRWEKEEGLPVHRHVHKQMSTVYAYRPELDAWWNNHHAQLEQGEAAKRSPVGYKRASVASAAMFALLVVLGALWWQYRDPSEGSSNLAFAQRDWVLVTSFENRTGESILDGTLEHALERELSNSSFASVVSPQRIEDALRLMKKPLDTPLDSRLGREVCLRDGEIRAMLTGRVERLGSTYILSANLVDPSDGHTVAGRSEEAANKEEMWPAIRRLSDWTRETLGEAMSSIRQSEQKLEKVTTPSLRALQLFTQGDIFLHRREHQAAAELLKQAVAEDPDFAVAHMWMAYALRNQRLRKEAYMPHVERAVELSASATEGERYEILGKFHSIRGEKEKAIPYYEALLRLHPNRYWATNNLAGAYIHVGRLREAATLTLRKTELRPQSFWANSEAAHQLYELGFLAEAKIPAKRAAELLSTDIEPPLPMVAWLEFFPVYTAWFEGGLEQALSEVERIAQTIDSRGSEVGSALAAGIGQFYLTLGKFDAAEDWFRTFTDGSWRNQGLIFAAWLKGDTGALREYLDQCLSASTLENPCGPAELMLSIRAGFLSRSETALVHLERRHRDRRVQAVKGQLALARGNTAGGLSILQNSRKGLHNSSVYFMASETLAASFEEQNDLTSAVQVLKEASSFKRAAYHHEGPFWLRTQWRLAQLYRKVGRNEDAQKIEDELRKLLAYADREHPILMELSADPQPMVIAQAQ